MIGNNNLRISKYECFNKKGSVSNVGVKDSSTTLRMTRMIANVNICVTLNEVEGSFDIYTPIFAKESLCNHYSRLCIKNTYKRFRK